MSSDVLREKPKSLKIALVAGEKSGDELGGPLIKALKKDLPNIELIGVGGPAMIEQGLVSFFELEKISVMGIIEPLVKFPELLSLRKNLKKFFLREKPDIFIGIDSPDFNLPIARYLKEKLELKTAQYVSPSVWAWRKGRIKLIERSIDKLFTLFPFEKEAYRHSSVEVIYVGHPLAERFNPLPSKHTLRKKYGIGEKQTVVALLPGSRKSEVKAMGKIFVEAANMIRVSNDSIRFFLPLVSREHRELISDSSSLDWIEFSYGNSQEILSIADFGILTSGTASLESVLLRTPCVVAYKTHWLTYRVIKPLLTIPYISLPNLLTNKDLIPELLQNEVTPQNIFQAFVDLQKKNRMNRVSSGGGFAGRKSNWQTAFLLKAAEGR